MNPADFDYTLPDDLIAQAPLTERSASRLLRVAAGGRLEHLHFRDLERLLGPGDLLVVNESRVIPARVFGRKESGGRIEMLIERILGDRIALAQLRSSHPLKPGVRIRFEGGVEAIVAERREPFFLLRFTGSVPSLLERAGHVPLPPYIRRPDEPSDRERYQTVFARQPGSVAAPTAGLHFDQPLLERLRAAGASLTALSLHVGAGTFAPLRESQLAAGRLHAERVSVSREVCEAVGRARSAGGKVVAVGTTVVRALETAALAGEIAPFEGDTDLFITPGFRFRVVDALITNFHLPRSSLLMLVCAFAGRDAILAAYRHAVGDRYRFFSYGDAMFVEQDATVGK